jgi:hypothetical protein
MGMKRKGLVGGKMTDGRIMLLASLQNTTIAKVATMIGCSRQLIGHLATGQRTPYGYEIRQALWEKLRIPPTAW